MSEFDFIIWVLSNHYLSKDQKALKEFDTKGNCIQNVRFDESFVRNRTWYLFRYDSRELDDHLPFFRNGEGSPESLRSFCDYILLSENNGKTYVFLIELKSGYTAGHSKQLEGGKCFMHYVIASAKRICSDNDFPEFDEGKILFRRVLVTPHKSTKRTTVVKRLPVYTELNDIIFYNEQTFRPLALMR